MSDKQIEELREAHEATEATVADLAERVTVLEQILQQAFAANQAARVVDPQAVMINARAGERTPKPVGGPVKFGAATPFDGMTARIDGKRRELLGK